MAFKAMRLEPASELQTGAFGALGGAFTGELTTELITRGMGLVGWGKFAVKAIAKMILGLFLNAYSAGLAGGWAKGVKIASYIILGSIGIDLLQTLAASPTLLAERLAVRIRTAVLGAEAVTRELTKLETTTAPTPTTTPPAKEEAVTVY